MQKTMIIMMGLQGSGKSTFYEKYLSKDHVRVNLDTLKTRNKEHLLIDECLSEGMVRFLLHRPHDRNAPR